MDTEFEVRSGRIAIGDPVMELVCYDVDVESGRYRLDPGALKADSPSNEMAINLDGPYLFVVDASVQEAFVDWFHETFEECGYVIPELVERLSEAKETLGVQVAFYWEQELAGSAEEGVYRLDPSKVVRAT